MTFRWMFPLLLADTESLKWSHLRFSQHILPSCVIFPANDTSMSRLKPILLYKVQFIPSS